jgi:bacteriorhodopsin
MESFGIKISFQITYIILLTTSFITIIEALRDHKNFIKNIMNLETAINLIAGYFYSLFITKIEEDDKMGKPIDYKYITTYRYIDWTITTPFMLLALCIALSINAKTKIHLMTFLSIIMLNYAMLGFGFLGELGIVNKITSTISGFIAFTMMFYIIFINYVKSLKKYSANTILFSLYVMFWSLYGIVYLFNDEYKTIFTNILDLITKCLIGVGLWIYYTRSIVT